MSFPDTIEQQADRVLERVRRGGDVMAAEAREVGEDVERRDFRLAAEHGARRYAEFLAGELEAGNLNNRLLREATLVAQATGLAGWLSGAALTGEDRDAMRNLVAQGFFEYYPRVPGEWVACYRLVAPC